MRGTLQLSKSVARPSRRNHLNDEHEVVDVDNKRQGRAEESFSIFDFRQGAVRVTKPCRYDKRSPRSVVRVVM